MLKTGTLEVKFALPKIPRNLIFENKFNLDNFDSEAKLDNKIKNFEIKHNY